ncbi:MAG TPA: DUF6520 family protein [Flavobacterium sp.]|jgi:type 1 fimbria pilin
MKRIFKTIVPALAIMLAIGGAFAAQDADKAVVPETGWINTPGPCAQAKTCSTVQGTLCTIRVNNVNHQAFGKPNPAIMSCTKVLYEP